tara:strand:+ start:6149 stop:7432 length:1284 start_codon:yes stop_codon:yes gene_type:complete
MQPGYRKVTNSVASIGDSTGFMNQSNVVDLIEQMSTSDEFYEIEPAQVVKCHLDPKDKDFPLDEDGNVDLSMLGAVTVSLKYSQPTGEVLSDLAKPLSPHIIQYPIVGEVVNVASYLGQLYYFNPLNLFGKVNMNRVPFSKGDGKPYEQLTKYNRKVYCEQGDTVIQGRFGQSIHFGSDSNFVQPFMKLTVGQNKSPGNITAKRYNEDLAHVEDVNLDEANIYITNNGHIPLRNASPSQMLSKNLGGTLSSVISLNADSISLNAKGFGEVSSPGGDIFGFADRNINLSAQTSINLETENGTVNLGTYVGDSKAGPAVIGKALNDFLDDMLVANEVFLLKMIEAKADIDIKNAREEFKKKISDLRTELDGVPRFYSDKVFIPNRKEQIVDDLDVEELFSNAEWPSQPENVTSTAYEIENPTTVAGVRG